MNKLITLLLILGIGITSVFFGCKRSITSNSTPYMKAKIKKTNTGDIEYSTPNCMAFLTGNTLVIEGLSTSSPFPTYPYIAISIPTWFGATGPYALDSFLGHPNLRYFMGPDNSSNYKMSNYGMVYINSVSTELITGTFNCTTKDSTDVESGAFTAKLFK
jgi:hypothetical protein